MMRTKGVSTPASNRSEHQNRAFHRIDAGNFWFPQLDRLS